jgi:multidrug efflux system outer membrane protein
MNRGAAAAMALLLAGCVVGPDYHAPAPARLGVPANYAPPVTPPASGEPAPVPADLAVWWRQLDDPLLTDLIGRATAGNLRIAQSLARLAQAREARIEAHADLLQTLAG